MQQGAPAPTDRVSGPPSRKDELRWAEATAGFIRTFLNGKVAPDFAELGHLLRERDNDLCHGEPQPAQVGMAHVMRAIAVSGISLADGAHIMSAYLAEERGAFTEANMLEGFSAIGADMQSTTFGAAVKSAAQGHAGRDAFMWVAAALRVWLDVPAALESVIHPSS